MIILLKVSNLESFNNPQTREPFSLTTIIRGFYIKIRLQLIKKKDKKSNICKNYLILLVYI